MKAQLDKDTRVWPMGHDPLQSNILLRWLEGGRDRALSAAAWARVLRDRRSLDAFKSHKTARMMRTMVVLNKIAS